MNKYDVGWIAFVGCMFLGIGIGMLFDRIAAGTMIGMGTGFVMVALFNRRKS